MPRCAAALLLAALAATACARGGQGTTPVPADPIREEVEPARAEDLEGGGATARGADASELDGDTGGEEESFDDEADGTSDEPAPEEDLGGEEDPGGGVDLGDEIEIEIDEE